jgi:hypothetical protein
LPAAGRQGEEVVVDRVPEQVQRRRQSQSRDG